MKVLLIRPWVNKNITTVKNFLFGEPMGLECASTLFKELGASVELVDFMVDTNGKLAEYLERVKPDIVGITSQCTDVANVLEIAKATKSFAKETIVIVGGVQASCFPNSFFSEHVDHVFKSTTRENVKQLYEALPLKTLPAPIDGIFSKVHGFVSEGDFCQNEYVIPDRSSTAKYRHAYKYIGYQPCAILQTSYGCRNRCSFCIRWKLEGPTLREIDIHAIVDQIEALDEPYIMICDNDFLINRERLETFCDLLEKKNIKKSFMCYGSVNSILEKSDLFARLRKNGLLAVIVGYEAFDDKQLKTYNKAATVDENLKATQCLQSSGIACWGSFIIHPDWDKSDFKTLTRYIGLLKPELITFSPLVPHPLTPLYETYKSRLLYPIEAYDKWNFGDVLIHPSKLSLRAYYWEVLKLAFVVNMNLHSVRYTLKAFPLHNTFKMVFGFNALFSVYIKNMFSRRSV